MDSWPLRNSALDGDTADIEAYSAPVLGFDDCGAQAELCGANRRDIPPGPAPGDDVIVGHGPT